MSQTRTFHINTEPHRAVVGDTTLLFQPEVVGAEFMTAYAKLREAEELALKALGSKPTSTKHAKAQNVDPADMAELDRTMNEFLEGFLLPESVAAFRELRMPDRVKIALIEFVAELYGGGSGNPDAAGGTSSG